MVFNTGETSEELRLKYNPDGSLLRKVQLRMLDMLVYIDSVCKDQGIDYMLGYGTALGAVRHHGFIPWDDDLDIFIDRHDYIKLSKYLMSNPHPQFKLHCQRTDHNYLGTWNSLRDTKSLYIQESKLHKKRKYQGLQIDFFPIEKGSCLFLRKLSWNLYYYCVYKMVGVCYPISKISFFFLSHIFIPLFRLFNIFGNQGFYSLSYGCGDPYKVFPKDILFPTKGIDFEGHVFQGPAKVEDYLKVQYQDYMSLPNIKDRSAHDAKYKIWE